jgi:hypothetical protein
LGSGEEDERRMEKGDAERTYGDRWRVEGGGVEKDKEKGECSEVR